MDGASKFVKGDAIASIIITIINILGGMAVGMLQQDMGGIAEVAETYTLLTVGDGLVTQIPALLLSTATGVIVTRAASEHSLGEDMSRQVFSDPKLLSIAAGVLLFLVFVPGLPKLPSWCWERAGLVGFYHAAGKSDAQAQSLEAAKAEAEESKRPDSVFSLRIRPIELELGYADPPGGQQTGGRPFRQGGYDQKTVRP